MVLQQSILDQGLIAKLLNHNTISINHFTKCKVGKHFRSKVTSYILKNEFGDTIGYVLNTIAFDCAFYPGDDVFLKRKMVLDADGTYLFTLSKFYRETGNTIVVSRSLERESVGYINTFKSEINKPTELRLANYTLFAQALESEEKSKYFVVDKNNVTLAVLSKQHRLNMKQVEFKSSSLKKSLSEIDVDQRALIFGLTIF